MMLQQHTTEVHEHLDVGAGHQVHIARFGNPNGIPLLFIHGGPGSGCNPYLASLFSLDQCQLLQWDQRGCGTSKAQAPLLRNTTDDLLADMEHIRQHYAGEQWLIYGGSWGATLALAYAKQYPERVLGLVLRGSFLAREQDLQWFIECDGLARQLPEAYQRLQNTLQADTGQSLIARLYALLQDQTLNLAEKYHYAAAWDAWEMAAMGFNMSHNHTALPDKTTQQKTVQRMQIYSHYGVNQFFMANTQLGVLEQIERLTDIPAIAVHGSQDQVCPLHLARDLKQAWLSLDWREVDAGHIMESQGLQQAVQQAVGELIERIIT